MKHMRYVVAALALAMIMVLAGCQMKEVEKPVEAPKPPVTLTYYVPTEDGRGVVAKKAEVPAEQATPQKALELILESEKQNPYSVFPKGLQVLGVMVQDGVATVNWNKAFAYPVDRGSLTEQLELASVVNTLTEFKEIRGVSFTVEGHPIHALSGHFDLTKPLDRKERYIVKN